MIKLACEAPLAWISEVSQYLDYEYALAHLVLNSKEYKDHFIKKLKEGKTIILDNSAFELGGSISPTLLEDLYYDLYNETKGNIYLIAPDVLGYRELNTKSIKEFLERTSIDISKIIGTVQGENNNRRICSYVDLKEIGFKYFAIPMGWYYYNKKWEVEGDKSRLELLSAIQYLSDENESFHILGCTNYELISQYKSLSLNIKTMDTSFPVKATLNKENVNSHKKTPIKINDLFYKTAIPDDFYKELLKENIETFKRELNEKV